MMAQRVGYIGKHNVAVGAAWAGLLHLEDEPFSFTSLCGRRLTMASTPENILNDSGILAEKLSICKRCQAKALPA